MKKIVYRIKARETGSFILGGVLFAFSLNVFLAPRRIIVGGASGIATALNALFGFGVGWVILAINLPLIILNAFVYGIRFTYRTFAGVLLTSVMTELLSSLPQSESEPLICALLGGVCMGSGVGILFHSGVTTGGSDLAAFLLKKKYPHISVGRLIFIIDMAVIVVCAVALSSYDGILYSVIACTATAVSLDGAESILGRTKLLMIVSSRAEDIIVCLSDRVSRGVVILPCTRYVREGKGEMLMCTVRRTELYYVKDAVIRCDPDAYLIVTDVSARCIEGEKK